MSNNDSIISGMLKRNTVQKSGTTFSLVLSLIGLCVCFTILSPYFLTVKNFLNIGVYTSIVGVMAAGITVAMLLGAMDISMYATATLSAIVAALLTNAGLPFAIVAIASLLAGAICGAINGTLIALFKIPAIIVTLGTMQIFRGVAYLVAGGQAIMIKNVSYSEIGRGSIFGIIPICLVIMIAIFIIIHFVLRHTIYGRRVYAVGGNQRASYLTGINVVKTKYIALIICGITSATAGLITSSQVSAAIPSNGQGSEMGVLSAVILGGISLAGGKGTVSGTVIGVLILAIIQNGLTLLSVKSFYQMVISGAVLIIAVLVDVIRSGALKEK